MRNCLKNLRTNTDLHSRYGRAHKEPNALLFSILLVGEGIAAGLVLTVINLAHHTFFGQNVKEPVPRKELHLNATISIMEDF